ncbi:hypothetical protein A3L09_04540 [Thermococcus profundus]|uniref:Uncharacterized protein n=1 Tax=Thermococcus profundus TaxID=49899 RepID=A0A2Z2M8G5_THEPR|nr:hypothetical protein [Thermococcus profundus]ASJ02577.1 hypothetical protein A3L09_04540 [Thermococcus profundus]
MKDPYLELAELLREEREALTPQKRVRDFQERIQRIPNGEEVEVSGFLLLRKPPNAPKDAAYYLLSPLSPGELRELPANSPRSYVAVRIDEKTVLSGKFLSGSYVVVHGVIDAYPWGNMRMVRATSITPEDYSEYWKEYKDMALKPEEVEELISTSIYANHDFQLGLIYSLYGSPRILESPRDWGEGYEFSVLGYKGRESGVLTLWRILKFLHSLLPRELRFRKNRKENFVDNFLDLDFKVFDPNNTPLRYYVPRSPGRLSKGAERAILEKRTVGLLALPKRAHPGDSITGKAETPFVFIPEEDERPYLEEGGRIRKYLPNLIVTVFLEREKVSALSASKGTGEAFRRKFEDWLMEKRSEYGWKFDVLTIPGGVFDVGSRYELSLRLFGSIARLEGNVRRSHIRTVQTINDEILNDWMTVLSSLPQSEVQRLLKNYRGYVPSDRRAAKALTIFRDLESTTLRGTVSRAEFERALIKAGFSQEGAARTLEMLIREGYLYEPAAGKLRLVR